MGANNNVTSPRSGFLPCLAGVTPAHHIALSVLCSFVPYSQSLLHPHEHSRAASIADFSPDTPPVSASRSAATHQPRHNGSGAVCVSKQPSPAASSSTEQLPCLDTLPFGLPNRPPQAALVFAQLSRAFLCPPRPSSTPH